MLLENGFWPTKNPKVPSPWGSLISTDRLENEPLRLALVERQKQQPQSIRGGHFCSIQSLSGRQVPIDFRPTRLLYNISPEFT
jgi:hypothetical protein